MINVYPIKGGYERGFIVVGHAESAEHGQDLVCAAVSAITQTTLLGLQMFASIHKEVKDGFMLAEVTRPNIQSYALIKSMIAGLALIEMQHKENLQVWEDDLVGTEDSRIRRGSRETQTAR